MRRPTWIWLACALGCDDPGQATGDAPADATASADGEADAAAIDGPEPAADGAPDAQAAYACSPRASATGARLAYVAPGADGGDRVVVVSADWGSRVDVSPSSFGATSTVTTYDTAWSAAAQRLAFAANDGVAHTEMFVADLSLDPPGPAVRVNVDLTSYGDVGRPVFMNDGARLLYFGDQRLDGVYELFLVDLCTGVSSPVPVNAPLPTGAIVQSGVVSPDERWIVYHSRQDYETDWQLFAVDATRATLPRPTPIGGPWRIGVGNVDPSDQPPDVYAFSPDGHWLMFRGYHMDFPDVRLFVVDMSGAEPGPLIPIETTGVPSMIRWSPEGGQLAFRLGPNLSEAHEVDRVLIGAGLVPAPERVSHDGAALIGTLAWSPAEDVLAYQTGSYLYTPTHIHLVDLRTSIAGPALDASDTDANPGAFAFAPDGSALAFVADGVYVASIVDGIPAPPVRASAAGAVRASLYGGYPWARDRSTLLYTADGDQPFFKALFGVPFAGGSAGTAQPISGPMALGGEVEGDAYEVGWAWRPDGRAVAYRADQDVNEMIELYAVDWPGDVPGAPVKVSAAPDGNDVRAFWWLP
jgi:Tol biopolymer transport system component